MGCHQTKKLDTSLVEDDKGSQESQIQIFFDCAEQSLKKFLLEALLTSIHVQIKPVKNKCPLSSTI